MKANILIVDDEKFNLDAIRRVLRKEKDYNLYFANNGDEALDILRNNSQMHMIITDQRMPGMTGIELLQKSLRIAPFAIRIILTAFTDSNDMIDAINKGHVYRYIIKPWNPEELKINIKLGLDYYKAVAEKLKLVEELRIKSRLLEKQNVELRKLADMKSRFLVVSSHELRTPATIISGSLELLQINNKNLSNEQNKTLHNAISGSKRLNKIIETFFEMVKLDSQSSNFNLNDVYFNDLIRAVISRSKNIFDKRKLNVEILSEKQLWLRVDQKKIYMVFENLISNAIKFTPDSGKILISWEEQDNNFAKISIKDTGIGIPA
ncbi:MAG: response regulator, partial [Calditrichia bacterium]|nr:response regulator [Calditrichia bacterium]